MPGAVALHPVLPSASHVWTTFIRNPVNSAGTRSYKNVVVDCVSGSALFNNSPTAFIHSGASLCPPNRPTKSMLARPAGAAAAVPSSFASPLLSASSAKRKLPAPLPLRSFEILPAAYFRTSDIVLTSFSATGPRPMSTSSTVLMTHCWIVRALNKRGAARSQSTPRGAMMLPMSGILMMKSQASVR